MHHLPQLSDAALPFRMIARWWRDWGRIDAASSRPVARPPMGANSEPAIMPPMVRSLPGKWPDSASLLDRRMAILHVDVARIAKTDQPGLQAMQMRCALCGDKFRCDHELSTGAGNGGWRSYCRDSDPLHQLLVRDGGKLSTDRGD